SAHYTKGRRIYRCLFLHRRRARRDCRRMLTIAFHCPSRLWMSFKQSRGQLRSLVVVLACLAAASAVAQDQAPERPSGWTGQRPVESRRFMGAAAHPLAVEAGYKILRAGGSAVHATIAVQLVLGLTEPQ